MSCTWENCAAPATHPQIGKDGEQWAHLCARHHEQLAAAIMSGPSMITGAWVLAQGGHKKAAERMMQHGKHSSPLFAAAFERVMKRFVEQ